MSRPASEPLAILPDTIIPELLAECANRKLSPRFIHRPAIQNLNTLPDYEPGWTCDIISQPAHTRQHGNGPSLGTALAAAMLAEPVKMQGPYFPVPHHHVDPPAPEAPVKAVPIVRRKLS